MALVQCSECGRDVSEKAAVCVGCGAPISACASARAVPVVDKARAAKNARIDRVAMLIAGVIALLAVAWLYFNLRGPELSNEQKAVLQGEKEERRRMADTVDSCESRYQEMNSDRQYTPEMLRIHSQVCRKLRSDYAARWGGEP